LLKKSKSHGNCCKICGKKSVKIAEKIIFFYFIGTQLKCAVMKNLQMEQHTFKNVNNCLNTNIYSYLETSGGQSSKLYLSGVHFFQRQC
jgi:hypothetical protein